MRTTRTLALFGWVLAALTSTAAAQNQIPWITDWRQARDLAQQQHRLVLLHFWSESCAPCRRLEQHVFIRPEVVRAITTGYIPVKINVQQEPQLVQHYRVGSWPTDIIVDAEGRVLHRQISPQDPNQYIALLDSVKAQHGAGLAVTPGAEQPAGAGGLSLSGQAGPPQGTPGENTNHTANATNRYSAAPQNQLPDQSLAVSEPQTAAVGQPYANPYVNRPPHAPPSADPSTSGGTDYAAGHPQMNPHLSQQQAQVPPAAPSNRWTQQTQQTSAVQAASLPQLPTQPTLAMDGYCPVTLVEKNTWSKGDPKWGAVHRGRTYLFTSYVSQQRFLANPDLYSPVLSGYDPVRYFDQGNVLEGKREHGLYYGEQYFLFADEGSLEQFRGNPQKYVAQTQVQTQQQQRP